ncbi:MAG TPA: hypothetical protein VIL10_09690 [Marmoricola sp.]|jgi:hypothetical protein
MSTQRKGRRIEVEGVPEEEDLSTADAEDRVELDPSDQVNRPDRPGPRDARTDADPPG